MAQHIVVYRICLEVLTQWDIDFIDRLQQFTVATQPFEADEHYKKDAEADQHR